MHRELWEVWIQLLMGDLENISAKCGVDLINKKEVPALSLISTKLRM